jgi:DNA repair protein RadC
VEPALRHQAAALILAHYSPGSDGCPMPIDISIGQWLFGALDAVKVNMLLISQVVKLFI